MAEPVMPRTVAMSRFVLAVSAFLLPLTAAFTEPPKLDLSGDPVPAGAIARLGSTRWRVGNGVHALRFQADGTLLTISDDLLGQVWDTTTGRELRRFDIHAAIPGASANRRPLTSQYSIGKPLALSSDGKRFAVVGADGHIHLLDLTSGKYLKKVGDPSSTAPVLGLSSDGSRLAEMT